MWCRKENSFFALVLLLVLVWHYWQFNIKVHSKNKFMLNVIFSRYNCNEQTKHAGQVLVFVPCLYLYFIKRRKDISNHSRGIFSPKSMRIIAVFFCNFLWIERVHLKVFSRSCTKMVYCKCVFRLNKLHSNFMLFLFWSKKNFDTFMYFILEFVISQKLIKLIV